MNEPKNDGGPAFPQPFLTDGEGRLKSPGMTLRDFFAAAAMVQLADPHVRPESNALFAKSCYAFADALLAERKNP